MTPEKLASDAADDIKRGFERGAMSGLGPYAIILGAIRDAVAAEREVCAKVAESTQFRVALIGEDCDVYKHRDGDYVTPVIAAAIRARGSLGPVIQHTEKTAEAADIPMEWVRYPVSKPDDVDYPADHFGDLGGRG